MSLIALRNMFDKPRSLLIGVPYYRHLPKQIMLLSEDIAAGYGPRNYRSAITKYDSALLHAARNDLVALALRMKVDYLFFLDSDMGFEDTSFRDEHSQSLLTQAIKKVLDNRLPVCGGFAVARQAPHLPVVYRVDPEDPSVYSQILNPPSGGTHEVDAIGCAFLAIKREVLLALKSQEDAINEPIFWFRSVRAANGTLRTIGEDILFCQKVKSLGFPIHCDFDAHIGHQTEVFVMPEHYKTIYQQEVLKMQEENTHAGT